MSKTTKVELVSEKSSTRVTLEHARRMLSRADNIRGGKPIWKLSKDSKWEFKDNDLKLRQSNTANKDAEEQKGD